MSKESDEYLTPPTTAKAVNDFFFGPVDLDPYAHPDQFVQARMMRTLKDACEPLPSKVNTMFVNPPFSEAKAILPQISHFCFQNEITALVLVPSSPGSAYWAKAVWQAPHVSRIAWLKRQTFYGFEDGKPCECRNTIRQDTVMLLIQGWRTGFSDDPMRLKGELDRFKSLFLPLSRCVTTAEAV